MTDHRALFPEAAKARSAGGLQRASLPSLTPPGEARQPGEANREKDVPSELRAEKVQRDGGEFYLVEGYASMTERKYEMWDFFGPYDEIVTNTAFDETLAADPMVVYRFNHGGMSMANTRNGRLELWADSLGLGDRAWINAERRDVQDLVRGIEDKDVTEQSFMFMIEAGSWNDDYTEFRIDKVNIDRGDVGPVTYGANPHTIVATRSGALLAAIPTLPALAAREAYSLLTARQDLGFGPLPQRQVTALRDNTTPSNGDGSSLRLRLAQLEIDKQHQ